MDGNNMNQAPDYTNAGATEYTYATDAYTEAPASEGKNGTALWGMILGIASVVCCWSGFGVILGIIGLIMSAKGKKKLPEKKGMSMTGIICSIAGIILGLIIGVIYIIAIISGTVAMSDLLSY